jgi:uncharacterized protein (DUF1499 family)
MPENAAGSARTAALARALGLASLACLGVGAAAAASGALPALTSFVVSFQLGLLLAVIGLTLAGVGLYATRTTARRSGRSAALTGMVASLASLLVVGVVIARSGATQYPTINDITTDPENPPAFTASEQYGPRARDEMGYDASFAVIQLEAYPDLAPILLDVPPATALERVGAAAEALGWTVVKLDPAAGTLEAYDTTSFFRFVDDVSIRVQAAPGGRSRIDIRSKSRDGRGDIGANALRIRAFRDALRDPD